MSAVARKRELIRETEWVRIYLVGRGKWCHSKFLTDGLQVSADSVKRRWPSFAPEEQFEFAAAFVAKPSLTTEDLEILKFLMESGAEHVWCVIAGRLVDYPDRPRALSFLLERAASARRLAGSYFDALQRIGDARAIPVLRQRYEEFRRSLALLEQRTVGELLDYLGCLDALWRLEGPSVYKNALRELLAHPDETVREAVQHRLAENSLQDLRSTRVLPASPGGPAQPAPELVKETEWSRVYCGETNHCWRVSKFRTDGLEVAADSIRERWSGLELEQQVEFAEAFCQKPAFTPQDQEILQLLIEEGLEYVRTTTGLHLRSHLAQEQVLSLVLEKVAAGGPGVANYYEVLRWLGDETVIPQLRKRYEEYRRELSPFEQRRIEELYGYLHCCRTLWALTESPEYQAALEELLPHPDEQIRRAVQRFLPPEQP